MTKNDDNWIIWHELQGIESNTIFIFRNQFVKTILEAAPKPTVYARHQNFFDFTEFYPNMPHPLYFSFVRHPVDRQISWYYYRRNNVRYIHILMMSETFFMWNWIDVCKQILFSVSLWYSRFSNSKLWVQTCSSIWESSHIDWKILKTGCLHCSASREVHNIDNRCCWLLEGRYNLGHSVEKTKNSSNLKNISWNQFTL